MSWDNIWEDVFQKQEWGKYPGEDLIRFVARNFYQAPQRREIKILEVGCGPGANLWYMAREGFSVYGIDGSRTAIERAENRLDKECPGWTGQLCVGDILNLPYENDFFDAVIDHEAVSCNSWDDSRRIFSEMVRVCKKNGKIFSRTFATGCWGEGTGMRLGHNAWKVAEGPLLDKGYVRFTAFEEIPQLLNDVNLLEVELLTRTIKERRYEVKEWLITGEKK